MKRIALALLLLATGVIWYARMTHQIDHTRLDLEVAQVEYQKHTARMEELRHARTWLTGELAQLREQLKNAPSIHPLDLDLAACLSKTNGLANMPAELRDRLKEEMGLNWHTSKDYVLISKDTLKELTLSPVKGATLSDAVCAVLAITPEERERLETVLAENEQSLLTWAGNHLQRAEPGNNVVAKVSLPGNPELAQSLTNRLFSTLDATLGSQRSAMLRAYAQNWIQDDMGCFGSMANTLTITQGASGPEELYYEVELNGSWEGKGFTIKHSGPISLEGTTPSLFHKLFPGSWRNLAMPEAGN